ncbi:transmembrane protein 154-like [Brienomyrus brachyistius]|uniref:transmembrane protein 154-like n=1 Tax=Brienomyrus brachyistius TaxID=42636 RepID=UPI0020B44F95|nr:transmembrane protein 154-like [Brienomyrus brachyistius]
MPTPRWTDMTAADFTENLSGVNATSGPEVVIMESLWPVAAALATALLLTAVLLGIFTWLYKKKKEAPGANKKEVLIDYCIAGDIPAPVFEDDVPSVLELDMEDLDKWGTKTSYDRYEAHDCALPKSSSQTV